MGSLLGRVVARWFELEIPTLCGLVMGSAQPGREVKEKRWEKEDAKRRQLGD